MSKTLKVEVNESSNFIISEQEIKDFDLVKISENSYHAVYNNQSINIEVLEGNYLERNYKLNINGKVFDSKIYNELDMLIDKMGFQLSVENDVNNIIAPMPGLILNIEVKEGDHVKENEPILILEAMKMENVLVAPKDTTIKTILVKKGESVDKNDLLIEFGEENVK